jgi:NAD+ synthase (glutamine-hydrolysing)
VAIGNQRVLGMVPKTFLPNYSEYYEQRWFVSGTHVNETEVSTTLGTFQVRVDQLFRLGEALVGAEICEDLWAPINPGTHAALAGANVVCNLSASNELISKADYRQDLVRMTSANNFCSYIYAGAGPMESTKDVVFGGHCLIAEAGQLLGQSKRFELAPQTLVRDIDLQRLQHDRGQNTTFAQMPRPRAYRIGPDNLTAPVLDTLRRDYPKQPFVPEDENEFAARAQEILQIQATGLARRMLAAKTERLVIGLSGGLDSTLAFLVAKDALGKLDLPAENLHALTLPGPGTTTGTLTNAHRLAQATGVSLQEISIEAAVAQHLTDLSHGGAHDVVFENAQARERTQILFNNANQVGGIVVGTGDLSELALGWATFNADQMANYNVNASVPKTLMAYLVRWYAQHRAQAELAEVLQAVLETPISPELIPPENGEISQRTEDLVGPYELHDFFLYHWLRFGSSPTKIFALACRSFRDEYTAEEIKQWLAEFFRRFMTQQFKRTTLPPGPKVGSVSLSPRGDWRMPDEAGFAHLVAEVESL